MIIYGLTINNGGLLRVTESMFDIFDYLDEDFPLRIVYFSEKKVEKLNEELFIHQPWNQKDPDQLSDDGVEKIVKNIKRNLKDYTISRIIFESSTYRYWKNFDCKKTLDIHILEKPLYQTLISNPRAALLDQVTPDSIYTLLVRMGLVSMKREVEALTSSDHLISNSKTTSRDLNSYYANIIEGKRIDLIPVTTEVSKLGDFQILSDTYQKNPKLIYFGRFHPQKGIHFLLETNWKPMTLSIKGFEESLVSNKSLKKIEEQGIRFINWTSEATEIARDLSKQDFVIFPSLYEPFGLALSESLKLGKICIAHDNKSGHNEQITNGINGYLIDFNSKDFKSEIYKITQKPKEELMQVSLNAKNGSFSTYQERLAAFAKMLKEIL